MLVLACQTGACRRPCSIRSGRTSTACPSVACLTFSCIIRFWNSTGLSILGYLIVFYICTNKEPRRSRMKQIIHGPAFLNRYQKWWMRSDPLSVADVEFAVLILRMCAYAAQFLPSPTYSVYTFRCFSLSDIRKTCSDVGDSFACACV